MAWFTLARVLFVSAVAYTAAILQPFPLGATANVGIALGLAAMVVLFERCLRQTALTHVLGALIGCVIGLAIAHTIVTGMFWSKDFWARLPRYEIDALPRHVSSTPKDERRSRESFFVL